ncbi:MAG: hypothetical protein CVU89_17495 [Firmicutes bacterium HGW-Firmicutes-14]|nr:MAG: hypothetical protein CVU89_17495 [Firmicutes bacterium HGW-Firmicutes-14]
MGQESSFSSNALGEIGLGWDFSKIGDRYMLDIKKATSKDFQDLARLISGDIAWSRYGIDYEAALLLIKSAEDEFYIARNDQETIGFCALRLTGVGNIGAYMRMILVSESYRNQGIGKKLLEYIWDLVIKHVPNLFLICSTDNLRAQKFYERQGFKRVGTLDNLVITDHDEILYWKTGGPLR